MKMGTSGHLPEFTGREYEYGTDPTMMRTLDGHIEPYKITRKATEDGGDDLSNPDFWEA